MKTDIQMNEILPRTYAVMMHENYGHTET